MKLDTSIGDIGAKIKPANIAKKIGHVWLRLYHIVFLIFFVMLLMWGGYFWYSNQNTDGWSEEQKDVFVKTRIESNEFKEERFTGAIETTKRREDTYAHPPSSQQNLFYRNVRPETNEASGL